jgi:hypothetical protein
MLDAMRAELSRQHEVSSILLANLLSSEAVQASISNEICASS